MIKANELRVGNWVNYLGTPIKILSGAQIDRNIKAFRPITLTPEILERCQLEYLSDPINGYELTKHICIVKNIDRYSLGVIETSVNGGEYVSEIRRIEYMHELQNLIFSLTGEELEIKQLEHA